MGWRCEPSGTHELQISESDHKLNTTTRKKKILWVAAAVGLVVLSCFAYVQIAFRPKVQRARTQVLLGSVSAASSSFRADAHRWPTSSIELVSNAAAKAFIVPSPPWRDAWGHLIVYEPFTTNSGFGRAVSYGRDGKPGGDGSDADLEARFP